MEKDSTQPHLSHPAVELPVAVLVIARYRMTKVASVYPDLVGTPRLQSHSHQGSLRIIPYLFQQGNC